MEQKENPITAFNREAPEVARAFEGLIDALRKTDGLDDKTKQLIYIAIKASLGDTMAVYFHVPMARKAGATREEVRDAILITLTISGLKGVTSCLPIAMEVYDRQTVMVRTE